MKIWSCHFCLATDHIECQHGLLYILRLVMGLSSGLMQAMKAYEETLQYSPDNKVARSRVDSLRSKVSLAR